MSVSKHPLAKSEAWVFAQPEVGFSTHYVAVNLETGQREVRSISNLASCREGVVYNIRQGLQGSLCQKKHANSKAEWEFTFHQIKEVDLRDPVAKEAGRTIMKINRSALHAKVLSNCFLRKFAKACDIVMGPVCVMLGMHRPEGDWWRTDPEKILENSHLCWYGSDNFFLQHPVLVSIVTGLYRQVALACRAGYADQILASVDYQEVEECLSTNNWKQSLAIIKETRPWIEVPCAKGGGVVNYPFPPGYWRRLKCLQRGARRHGYEKVLGQNFVDGWALEAKGNHWSGLYNFWGQEGELTQAHRQLMELGKPLRRKKSGAKPASRLA